MTEGVQPTSAARIAKGILRTMRPHQWVKNLFVLAPLVFAKHVTHESIIVSALGAFGIFCLLAGAVYTLNDLLDVEADRIHPVKRNRPIASGQVPESVAKGAIVGLLVVCTAGSLLGPWQFAATAASYFILQTAYSLRLKQIAYLDVFCIATGFVLRVLAGGFAIRLHEAPGAGALPVSGYMLGCTAFLALFLGFGKRRHELASETATKQRKALKAYSARALWWALAFTGFGAVAVYFAYTFDPRTKALLGSDYLWVTTLHPLLGVLRFLQLVKGRPKAESPTEAMLRDVPFMANLLIWVVEVLYLFWPS